MEAETRQHEQQSGVKRHPEATKVEAASSQRVEFRLQLCLIAGTACLGQGNRDAAGGIGNPGLPFDDGRISRLWGS